MLRERIALLGAVGAERRGVTHLAEALHRNLTTKRSNGAPSHVSERSQSVQGRRWGWNISQSQGRVQATSGEFRSSRPSRCY